LVTRYTPSWGVRFFGLFIGFSAVQQNMQVRCILASL